MWKLALFLGALLTTTGAAAQSPAIGPQQPAANLQQCNPARTNTPCWSEFGLFIVTNMIRNTTQGVLDKANAQLEQQGRSSRVSIQSLQAFPPRRQQTQHFNQPNEWFVRVPYILRLKVTIPVTSDRTIGLPLDIDFTCDNWQTNDGQIVMRSVAGPPSFEGGNILESVFNVGNFIDSAVREAFVSPPPIVQQLPNTKCSTLGFSTTGTAQPNDDVVNWTVPRPRRPIDDVVAMSAVEVTFNRLKRLPARSTGGVLYRDVEDILLNMSANLSRRQKALTMRENDDVALDLPVIRLSPANFEQLVVIGNVEQPPNNPKDSAFATAARAQNYRPGTHVLRIPKWYSRPPGQGTTKPTFVSVPAYELTYTVRYLPTNVVSGGAKGAGGPASPGVGGGGVLRAVPAGKAPQQK